MLCVLSTGRKPISICPGLFECDREPLTAVDGSDRMIGIKRRCALRGLSTCLMLMIFGGFG